jgi:tartrate-resistant acid phosphatase type 5
VRFAAIGDYGLAGGPEADVAALVKSWRPDFVITLGDNNYVNGSAETIDANIGQYYAAFIFPYHGAYGPGAEINRFFPVLGNHDWLSQAAQPYLDYFTLPGNERYYDFNWGPLHLFALDSDSNEPDGVGRSSAQAAWLQARLAAAPEPWKIVYIHHPPYASGANGPVDWMRWPFKDWGADVVLAGHDHIYERLQVDGLPYLIDGLGGGPIYAFGTIDPGSLVRFNRDYGALLGEATSQSLTFQFITRAGAVIDTLSLEK